MRLTKNDISPQHTLKEYFVSKQSHGNKYSDTSNMELLCREIEALAQDSKTLDGQYKAIVHYYQNHVRQVIA